MKITLRDYQQAAKDKILEWVEERETQHVNTLVSITRSGKTLLSCSAIGDILNSGLRVWVIVDRIELLYQWREEFNKVNPDYPKNQIWFIAAGKAAAHKRPLQFVQVQTLTRQLKKVSDANLPDVIFLDEAHGVGFQRVVDKLIQRGLDCGKPIKQINLTATPTRHGKSQQQYIDKFPLWEYPEQNNKLRGSGKQLWYQAATAQQMIEMKRWKIPTWIVASDNLAEQTAIRFSGVSIKGDEYDDTSQAKVMIDLLDDHIREWQLNGGAERSTIWYCCNVDHVEETYKKLLSLGRKVAKVTGDTDPGDRKRSIEKFRSGEITDLVNCQCLTTGFDAPIASCGVWLRRTMSVGLFCQMAGRPLTYFEGIPNGLLMDFAGNLALHPFPEKIDWWKFNPCKKMFRDPSLVVCKVCKHRHEGIPKPLHELDRKVTFNTGLGAFVYPENYSGSVYQLPQQTSLKCQNCGSPVYYDKEFLPVYAEWLKEVRSCAMSGEKPPKYKYHTAGISIGEPIKKGGKDNKDSSSSKLTIATMYDLGLWSYLDEDSEGGVVSKDKSEEWRKLRANQLKNFKGKKLAETKLSLLTPVQQSYFHKYPMAQLLQMKDINKKYRGALTYAYIDNDSPVSSFSCWDGVGSPPKDQVRLALYNIYGGNEETYLLLRNWIEYHLEKHTNQKKKGVCRQFLKLLCEVYEGWSPESEAGEVDNSKNDLEVLTAA